ncbi:glutaredoxin family protein [Alkalicoccus chagannorensis]|uniref:glutaredoxin family protein n=1 Tax=Alkalicoccus chagannorensis TaxID=427072 RepID=UPI000403C1E6|nr:glutaredoxin family protein [Alkalicoccus chagannorensis]
MSLLVYTTNDCVECDFVKKALDANDMAYEVRNVREHPAYQQEVEQLGFLGVPVTVYKEEAVKGMVPELEKLIAKAKAEATETEA